MGVAYCLVRTKPENIELLRNRPKALARFLFQNDDVYVEPKPGLLAKLFGRGSKVDTRPVPARSDDDETDLDKAWHIIHYLLCGDTGRGDGPLALIGDDLNPLADLDLGLGRPNVISPERVRAFAEAANGISETDFLVRFVPEKMPLAELYMGNVIARGDIDDMREYVWENFEGLRSFVSQASAHDEAIITFYT